jgi:hypothetical protein
MNGLRRFRDNRLPRQSVATVAGLRAAIDERADLTGQFGLPMASGR